MKKPVYCIPIIRKFLGFRLALAILRTVEEPFKNVKRHTGIHSVTKNGEGVSSGKSRIKKIVS